MKSIQKKWHAFVINISSRSSSRGFTLIELLVVIAIIGLLASVVLVSLNSARQKSRDARRLADIKQMANAMEIYFSDCKSYPIGTNVDLAEDQPEKEMGLSSGVISSSGCSGGISAPAGESGTIYIYQFPKPPKPADSVTCASVNNYLFNGSPTTYSVRFCLGAQTGQYSGGLRTLSEQGIK